jgi:hypothetical protein
MTAKRERKRKELKGRSGQAKINKAGRQKGEAMCMYVLVGQEGGKEQSIASHIVREGLFWQKQKRIAGRSEWYEV